VASFGSLSQKLTDTFSTLRRRGKLSTADVDETVREIRRALLDSDVALEVVKRFTAKVRDRALQDDVNRSLNPAQQVVSIVSEELVNVLGGNTRELRKAKTGTTKIVLSGLQGSGKTSFAGKLSKWLVDKGHTPVLVAWDLQRPGAVEQLGLAAGAAGAAFFAPEPGNGVGDPIAVAKSALKYAKDKSHDFMIIDTAGRLGLDQDLMGQASKICQVTNPEEILFVIDAMSGQDAVRTAKQFQEGLQFTGVVLSKIDGDAKGGAALSVTGVTGKPILFASTGEKIGDIEVFHPDRIASRILDMGDVLTLVEQAQQNFSEAEAKDLEKKIKSETFTLEDFLAQLQQLRKMGSLGGMLSLLPGARGMKDQIENIDETELIRTEAIIQSMTPQERQMPKILNGSRRTRIAKGSGTSVTEINQLTLRFEQAAKLMKSMAKGGQAPIAGLPPMPPGSGRGGKKKAKKKSLSRSGNPAKRAEEAAKSQLPKNSGSSFGLGS